jgi:hypothetical protein
LNHFDPEVVIRDVPGREACATRRLGGGSSDTTRHMTWLVTCRRVGQDRTIYFDIADAIEAEIRRNATIPQAGGVQGGPGEPLADFWSFRANAVAGTIDMTSIDAVGSLSIIVTLDLSIPYRGGTAE